MNFFLLLNVTGGLITFISRVNTTDEGFEAGKNIIFSNLVKKIV